MARVVEPWPRGGPAAHPAPLPDGDEEGRVLEPNLLLDFDELAARLLAQLRLLDSTRAAAQLDGESTVRARFEDEVLLDCFLLAAGLSQILADYLHRDFLSLSRVSKHLRLLGQAGARLRARRLGDRRLAAWGRELAVLVASLADGVAQAQLEPASSRGPVGRRPSKASTGSWGAAESVLLPLDRFPAGLRRSVLRPPNCFVSFDQHPEDYLHLVERFAARWPDRELPLLVVGLRTSGSYLAPLCASFLAAAGYRRVGVTTIRPGRVLDRHEAAALAVHAAEGGVCLLTDDPPRTGNQLAQTGAELERLGFATGSLVLLLQVPGPPDSLPDVLGRFPAVLLCSDDWTIHERLAAPAVREALSELLVGRSLPRRGPDGGEISVTGVDVEAVTRPTVERGHSAALFAVRLSEGATGDVISERVYAQGAGLGWFGRHTLAITQALADLVPSTYGFRDGVVFRAWLPEETRVTAGRLQAEREALAAGIAGYVKARGRTLRVADDRSLRLVGRGPAWELVGYMLAQAFGGARTYVRPLTNAAARRLLEVEHPVVVDGRMGPRQWFADGEAGELRKIDAYGYAFSNDSVASYDPIFDLAGAAAAAEAERLFDFEGRLRHYYEAPDDRVIPDARWLVFRLLHHLVAYWGVLAELAAEPADFDASFARLLAIEAGMTSAYQRHIAERYFLDLVPQQAGPLCAIDIDGVAETHWLGFSALSPAAALALRALARHGYRVVLASGRSLEDVRRRCRAFGLAGGVAAYGSVAFDAGSGRERSLLTANAEAELARLRTELEPLPNVYLDPAYGHSIRAYAFDAHGGRSGLAPETIEAVLSAAGVEQRVEAVSAVLHTDFVSASVDKGRGLRALARELGEDGEARPLLALAIGDTEHDLPMLELAQTALAPANGAPELRGRVEFLSHGHGTGLLEAVSRLLGHRPSRCEICRPVAGASPEEMLLLTSLSALNGGKAEKIKQAAQLAARLVSSAIGARRDSVIR